MNKRVSNIGFKLTLLAILCVWMMAGFPLVNTPRNTVVIEAEARGPGGRYVRHRPVDRRAARRVHHRHHRYSTGVYVYSLSPDCKEEVISNKRYYYCDGVFYRPYYQGNDLVYVEVEDPR